MRKHYVIDTGLAWAVAYDLGHGQPMAVCECGTEQAAAAEARRLNLAEKIARADALRASVRQATQAVKRRGLRYFEPDAFA